MRSLPAAVSLLKYCSRAPLFSQMPSNSKVEVDDLASGDIVALMDVFGRLVWSSRRVRIP